MGPRQATGSPIGSPEISRKRTPSPEAAIPVAALSTKTMTSTPTATDTLQPATATPSQTHTQTPIPTDTSTSAPTITLTPAPEEQPLLITDDFGVPMALVPAGPFEMGSEDGDDDERPIHAVTLYDFYIDQYEVTNASYAECVGTGICAAPSDASSFTRENYYGNLEYVDHPVIWVSWHDAQTYCEWRGTRLPTEAEWEKAARGGLEGALYPWGNSTPICELGAINGAKFDDDATCNDTDTAKGGSYQANGYGLYDMAGNVWEWVMDWYDSDYYSSSPRQNPGGPEEAGIDKVIRGGSWADDEKTVRAAMRTFHWPHDRDEHIGFRCVVDSAD